MSVKVKDLPIELTPLITDYTINDSGSVTTKRTTWQKILDLFVSSFYRTSSWNISAAGTDQATATSLSTFEVNRISTVGVGQGVKENAAPVVGKGRRVINDSPNTLLYYPSGTGTFYEPGGALYAAGDPISIAPYNQVSVFCFKITELTII